MPYYKKRKARVSMFTSDSFDLFNHFVTKWIYDTWRGDEWEVERKSAAEVMDVLRRMFPMAVDGLDYMLFTYYNRSVDRVKGIIYVRDVNEDGDLFMTRVLPFHFESFLQPQASVTIPDTRTGYTDAPIVALGKRGTKRLVTLEYKGYHYVGDSYNEESVLMFTMIKK